MTVDVLLTQLDRVRARGTDKWQARCPAHSDRSPSLSLRLAEDGRVLVHCFSGCTVEEICAALSIRVAELFPADPQQNPRRKRTKLLPKPWRYDWRQTASNFQFFADMLWLRSCSVLEAARGLNTQGWTDDDLDMAMNAVSRAYADLERVDFLEGLAFHFRSQGLKKEAEQDASRRGAA